MEQRGRSERQWCLECQLEGGAKGAPAGSYLYRVRARGQRGQEQGEKTGRLGGASGEGGPPALRAGDWAGGKDREGG
eukprot:745983-Rhodomonas_salina.2